jgi:hypothetical protein
LCQYVTEKGIDVGQQIIQRSGFAKAIVVHGESGRWRASPPSIDDYCIDL